MTTSSASSRNLVWKVLVPIAMILLLAIGGLYVIKSQVPRPTGNTSDTLPDLNLTVYGGGAKKLSEVKSKVLLINFWATWCSACVIEMPSIIELRKTYKDKGFDVIAVNLDDKPEAVLPKSLKQLGIDFPVYLDPDGKLAELFNVSAIPLTVVIDQNRKILLSLNGERDWNSKAARAQLEGWLAR